MAEAENPPNTNACDSDSHALGSSSSSVIRMNATLDVLRDARARTEAAEVEMAKEREAVRVEVDRRRAALEAEMARLSNDALQRIAGKSGGRKTKRAGETTQKKVSPSR